MIRITHSKDLFFAGMNHVKVRKTREDGSFYDHGSLSTPYDTAALKFIHHMIDLAVFDKQDVHYQLTHITDCE